MLNRINVPFAPLPLSFWQQLQRKQNPVEHRGDVSNVLRSLTFDPSYPGKIAQTQPNGPNLGYIVNINFGLKFDTLPSETQILASETQILASVTQTLASRTHILASKTKLLVSMDLDPYPGQQDRWMNGQIPPVFYRISFLSKLLPCSHLNLTNKQQARHGYFWAAIAIPW